VAIMGALLARSMAGLDLSGGAHGLAAGSLTLEGAARLQLAGALQQVFALGSAMALLGLAACALLPRVDFTRSVTPGAGEQPIEAEIATLDADAEPQCVRD
jgi:hypothetical protein